MLRGGKTSARRPEKTDGKQIGNREYLPFLPTSHAHQAPYSVSSFEHSNWDIQKEPMRNKIRTTVRWSHGFMNDGK
jgi:hypothetical protein